jgi:hypothetical protein
MSKATDLGGEEPNTTKQREEKKDSILRNDNKTLDSTINDRTMKQIDDCDVNQSAN